MTVSRIKKSYAEVIFYGKNWENFSLNFIVTEIMLFSRLIPGANIYSFIIYIEAKTLWSDVNLFENLVAVNKYLFIPTQIYFKK